MCRVLSVLTMYSRTWLWKFCSLIVTSSSSILHIAKTHLLKTHICGESIHCTRNCLNEISSAVSSQRQINDQNTQNTLRHHPATIIRGVKQSRNFLLSTKSVYNKMSSKQIQKKEPDMQGSTHKNYITSRQNKQHKTNKSIKSK